jgi:hypothetical protein
MSAPQEQPQPQGEATGAAVASGPVNGDPYPVWQEAEFCAVAPEGQHLSEVNGMSCRDAFAWYIRQGYHVRPQEYTPRGRRLVWPRFGYTFATLAYPTSDEVTWLLNSWQDHWQLAMINSELTELVSYDIDDMAQWRQFMQEHYIEPTAAQVTGREGGGLTVVYKWPWDDDWKDAIRQGKWSFKYDKIEVKSKAPVTVAPSLHHTTGRKYQWLADGPGYPEDVPASLLRARSNSHREEQTRIALFQVMVQRDARRWADELERAATLADVPERPGQLLGDFLADAAEEPEMEIPGLVPKQTRVVLTGEEGVGKSTLNRYVAFCHAAGIHPFTYGRYDGGVTVLLDCENARGLQQMRLAELGEALGPEAEEKARQRLVADALPGGIDLASPWWQEYLLRMVDGWKATLAVTGPLYKLCAAHEPKSEEFFTAVSEFLDQLRERGCSLWIEAHCRQSSPGFARDVFPYGNSGWRRWPEAGMHLGRSGALADWRGNRYADQVSWPVRLARVPGSRVLWRAEFPDSAAGASGESEAEKFRAIRAAVQENPKISLTALRLAVRDDGTWIRRAVEAGAITEHRAQLANGKPSGRRNSYEVSQSWAGAAVPVEQGGFQRWFEMADHTPADPEDEP